MRPSPAGRRCLSGIEDSRITVRVRLFAGKTSEYVRLALFHEIWRNATVESRRVAVPAARSRGVFTDEGVFRLIS